MTDKTAGADRAREMVEILQSWQSIERASMNQTAEIMERTQSPLIRMVMEIIRHDSLMHHRVQQFLVDSLTRQDVAVTREDVAEIYDQLEAHDQLERKTLALATQLREMAWTPVHRQLLDYLITDERKHDALIAQLEELKAGMTRASGA